MLQSVQPDHPVNSMLACKALANLVAAGHPLSVEKVSKVVVSVIFIIAICTSIIFTFVITKHSLNGFPFQIAHSQVVELLPALLPAASNNLETALASLLSNLSVVLKSSLSQF